MTRSNDQRAGVEKRPLRQWQEPQLKYVGHVGDVLQTGGGKLSPAGGDPGEMKVEKPHG